MARTKSPFLAPQRSAHLLHAAFPLVFCLLHASCCPCQQASAVVRTMILCLAESRSAIYASCLCIPFSILLPSPLLPPPSSSLPHSLVIHSSLFPSPQYVKVRFIRASGLAVLFYSRNWCGGVQVSLLAAQLQQNAQEDYRVYHRIAAAARRGVRPSMLLADQMSDCWSSIISTQSSVHIRLSIPSCLVRQGSPPIGRNDKDHGWSLRSSVADAYAHHVSSNYSTLYGIVTNCGCRYIVQCC